MKQLLVHKGLAQKGKIGALYVHEVALLGGGCMLVFFCGTLLQGYAFSWLSFRCQQPRHLRIDQHTYAKKNSRTDR